MGSTEILDHCFDCGKSWKDLRRVNLRRPGTANQWMSAVHLCEKCREKNNGSYRYAR